MGPDASRTPPEARVLLATASFADKFDEDAQPLLEALEHRGIAARPAVWDDPDLDWGSAELVIVRSTWDYAPRREDFLSWARQVGASSVLENPVEVLTWNTDKRYLTDLVEAGVPVVDTLFVGPHEEAERRQRAIRSMMEQVGEVVIKPSVSAGSKDTGRFTAREMGAAADLAAGIAGEGRTSMVQPYISTVDEKGETGLVYFDGRFSHAFGKAALLAPGGETEPGPFAQERIESARATAEQRELGDRLTDLVAQRFGATPLYARVDLLDSHEGTPVLLELELTEPSWFLGTDPDAAERAAEAIASRLTRASAAP